MGLKIKPFLGTFYTYFILIERCKFAENIYNFVKRIIDDRIDKALFIKEL
jgi:hypothetical protein